MTKYALLSILIVLLVSFVSCNQENIVEEDNGLFEVFMEISTPKALYSVSPDEIDHYEYKAVPEMSPMDQYEENGLNLYSVGGRSFTVNSVTATVVADSDAFTSITVTGKATAEAVIRVYSRELTSADIGTWTLTGCWEGTRSTSQPYHRIVMRTNSVGPMSGTYMADTGSGCIVTVSNANVSAGNWLCLELVIPKDFDCTANRVSFNSFLVRGAKTGFIENDIFGATDWKPLTLDASGRASLGYFSQGKWTFQARALNASGAILYGTHTSEHVYISKIQKNVIIMHLQMPNDGGIGTASLFFDVLTPSLEAVHSEYTLKCYATPITYNMNAAWRNYLGENIATTLSSWNVHTGVLTANMTGNTVAPTLTIKTYYNDSYRSTIISGIEIDGQDAIVPFAKESTFIRVVFEFNGNGSTASATFDLSSVPRGMYWLHFYREALSNVNTVVLRDVMLTDSELLPYGYSATSGYAIERGERTVIPISWNVTHVENDAMRFVGTSGGFSQGVYYIEVEFILDEGDLHIAGQALLVRLVSGGTTQILGRMDGGAYIAGSFGITEDRTEFSGYITCDGHVRTDPTDNHGALNAAVSESVTLRYVENPGSTHAGKIDWYFDGTKMATTTNGIWTSSFTSVGEHEISALLTSADDQKTGTAVVLLFVGV